MGKGIYEPRPRRWPQIGLKGLLALTTSFGVLLGWLNVQFNWIRDRHEMLRKYDAPQLVVYKSRSAFGPRLRWEGPQDIRTAPASLRIFGEPGVTTLLIGPRGSV